jgi:primosomal protein N' (replication factor Y)
MTYHTRRGDYENGVLVCHWCGRKMPLPKTCPSCSGERLIRMGYGTQRVEQELSILLPTARILRMDTDTTQNKASYRELPGKFRRHEADILLGTQMVTKGHDFPAVTLVGVLSADASLYLDDYRAAERTFAMLTQVIGRAGRSDKEGEAIIQTSNPDHECIKLACEQNYDEFYEHEIRLRKELCFPPFCDIAVISLSSTLENELHKASAQITEQIASISKKDFSDIPLVVFGPFEAPVYKVENKYRLRTVLKCRLNKRSREFFAILFKNFAKTNNKYVNMSIDFNPSNL